MLAAVARALVARRGGGPLAQAVHRGCASAATATLAAAPGPETLTSSSRPLAEAIRYYGQCYWELSKARLSMLVVSTAGVGFVMGSGEVVEWTGLAWTTAGTLMAAASANAFNQVMEVTNDAKMKRTMRRPLPSGRLSIPHAVLWAAGVGTTGVMILACKTNVLTATLGAANVALYTLAYTPLKQIHPVNSWVGAVVGAIPPLMGWAAASGDLDPSSWILAAALYFWQIPHFMALAYLCRNDYVSGGYKMLSLFDSAGRRTSLVALRNCVYLLPLGFVAYHLGTTSKYFTVEASMLTAGMGLLAALFYIQPSTHTARRLFLSSLLYLPLFMSSMVIHRVPNRSANSSKLGTELSVDTSRRRQPQSKEPQAVRVEKQDSMRKKMIRRPPIAFVSIAPFPFLPFPDEPYRS